MIMRLKHTPLAIALIVSVTSMAYAQAPETHRDRDTPDFSVQVWGDILADFSTRVWSYAELRSGLENGLPALTVTDDPAEIGRAVRALAKRIRVARAAAKQGEIFTPTISVEFRRALLLEIDANAWETLMDDNPGKISHATNRPYSKKRPLSSVPVNILARLPRLPDDIEYRFLGRDMILLDTRASVILDRIPYAIQCVHGDKLPCEKRSSRRARPHMVPEWSEARRR
jgi:hypothetical protein